MPFGDRVEMRLATVKRIDYFPGRQQITSRRVNVPEAEAPWWWSEYLTDEWKRRNRYKQKPRDGRTQWQRSEDEWKRQTRTWELHDFGTLGDKPGITLSPHAIWSGSAEA